MNLRRIAMLGVVSTILLGGCALFKAASRPVSDMKIEQTPERVERGRYLANSVAACMACHSPLDAKTHTLIPGTMGAGGRRFGKEEGLPADIYSSNITPDPETGLGTWSDDEILRAMREGVSKDGRPLFPLMPYPGYHHMSDEDAMAIVAYLRTIPPIKNQVPGYSLGFPLSAIVNTMPMPMEKAVAPAPAEGVERGKYVLTMASCVECHTPMGGAGPDMSKFLAGGHVMKDSGHEFVIPNITQDKETGIGAWTDQQIGDAIRYGRRPDGKMLHPMMPWMFYNGMNNQDLKALVAYLRTVPAIKNADDPKPHAAGDKH